MNINLGQRPFLLMVFLIVSSMSTQSLELVSKTIPLKDDIKELVLSGPIQITVVQGENESLKVTADKSQINNIQASVSSDQLIIDVARKSKRKIQKDELVIIELQLKALHSLAARHGVYKVILGNWKVDGNVFFKVAGSTVVEMQDLVTNHLELKLAGAVTFSGADLNVEKAELKLAGAVSVNFVEVNAESLEVDLAGSSDIQISGEGALDTLDVNAVGASDFVAPKLKSSHVELSLAGASDATVHAVETLDVKAIGASDAIYYGNPKVSEKTVGASSVIAK